MEFVNILKNYRHAIYAVLLLLPTFHRVPSEFYLLFIIAVLLFEKTKLFSTYYEFRINPFKRKYLPFWLMIIIFICSVFNKIFNGIEILCLKDYYAEFYLLPFLLLTSKLVFNIRLFKFLILITVFECVIGIFEYIFGVRSFLIPFSQENQIIDYSLLYDSRVYGLSSNSSFLGYKIFIAFLLIDFVSFKKWVTWIFRFLLFVGLILSFSRVIVAILLLYWFAQFIMFVVKYGWKFRFNASIQFILAVLFLSGIFHRELIYQFSRGEHNAETAFGEKSIVEGRPVSCAELHALPIQMGQKDPLKQGWGDKIMLEADKVQSSGRKLIWLNYLNYIDRNLITGNGSNKIMLRSWNPETQKYKLVHAHNSYLMIVATNGIIISLMYLLFYFFIYKWRNILVVGAILIYSFGNYGIFWGFSYMDVIFLIFLMTPLIPIYDDKRES